MTTTTKPFTIETFEAIEFPLRTLDGELVTARAAGELVQRFGERIFLADEPAEPRPETVVVESFDVGGNPWGWEYVGERRVHAESQIVTWLLVQRDDDDGGSLVVTFDNARRVADA